MDIREIMRSNSSSQQLFIVSAQDLKRAFLEWNEEVKANTLPDSNDKLISLKEAAEILHVHPCTLDRWGKSGYLPKIKIGRKVYYSPKEIDNIKANH
ncbi:helix-turn-helix domain-containing protein [Bacteroides gallinarum]|uniref:helix-turn-helix domain-containing protein n=1 Tax=Bacteroides gallinarum TaxID=376806 RepID=UPI000361A2A8|nr:helix-turn-helix domain-containing protein [Bacteroides gallinarum]